MIKIVAKRAPPTWGLFCSAILLGLLFGFNWLMADTFGEGIVKHNGICVVGEYNAETHTGSLTCGEYEKDNGYDTVSSFVSKVYIQRLPVSCKITENEYSGDTDWDCVAHLTITE